MNLDSAEQHYFFSVEQEFAVKDLKPVVVKVYDDYHPDDYTVAEYNAPCSTVSPRALRRSVGKFTYN
ncbi:UNVERIFIED_CONTAM: hypothetical protein K2H54_012078 [Gekko kuhli]